MFENDSYFQEWNCLYKQNQTERDMKLNVGVSAWFVLPTSAWQLKCGQGEKQFRSTTQPQNISSRASVTKEHRLYHKRSQKHLHWFPFLCVCMFICIESQ